MEEGGGMKIAVIDCCLDCPHRYFTADGMHCDIKDKETHGTDSIPEWCPLPDAEAEI